MTLTIEHMFRLFFLAVSLFACASLDQCKNYSGEMAKEKALKRKIVPLKKKLHNEWLDETIEPSDSEEVCVFSSSFR